MLDQSSSKLSTMTTFHYEQGKFEDYHSQEVTKRHDNEIQCDFLDGGLEQQKGTK